MIKDIAVHAWAVLFAVVFVLGVIGGVGRKRPDPATTMGKPTSNRRRARAARRKKPLLQRRRKPAPRRVIVKERVKEDDTLPSSYFGFDDRVTDDD